MGTTTKYTDGLMMEEDVTEEVSWEKLITLVNKLRGTQNLIR